MMFKSRSDPGLDSNPVMGVTIAEISPKQLAAYAKIPIAFTVHSILQPELHQAGLGGIVFREIPVEPYRKDYDQHETPLDWRQQFDVSNWGFLLATQNNVPLGGAALAYNTDGVNLLEGRSDLAVLWDIRIHPDWRAQGLGRQLFFAAVDWAKQRQCAWLKIETQNINVPACRFYQKMGCELGVIHRFAYAKDPKLAREVMLNWYYSIENLA